MPLTSSGKIDRKSLPEPGGSRPELAVSYLEPQTDLEIMIADIWKEVLKVDKIGIDDSFFELGGNSLDIIKVNNRIKQAFQVDMPVINMFRYSTLRLLAGYLKNDKTNESFTNKKQKIFKAVDRSRSRRREGIPKWRPPAKIERRLK
jgi:acyl carrier protein